MVPTKYMFVLRGARYSIGSFVTLDCGRGVDIGVVIFVKQKMMH